MTRRHRLLSVAITAVFVAAVTFAQQTGHPGQGSGTTSLTPLFAFQGFGDSYVRGRGALNPVSGGGFSQLAQTILTVPATNFGVDGLNSDAINLNVWTLVQPSPQQPSAYLLNGGSNDNTNCGTSTACLTNFKEEVDSSIARLAIPNQEQAWGSACTQTSGTWTADNSGVYVIPAPTYYLNPGTAMSASGNGSVLTCTVTSRAASARVGVNFQVTNSQTGTFTVKVDGVSQTDQCSGTTTFTSAPCSGQNLLTNATAIFRQEFAGILGTTHTVVITTTNAAKVNLTSVDTITQQPQVNSNYVVVLGTNLAFDSSSTYNAALQSLTNQFASDGALVAFANQQSITPGPGVNSTTDISQTATIFCDASASVTHPNDVCGYFHLAQTVVNATRAAGWNIFGTPRQFSNYSIFSPTTGISLGAGLITFSTSNHFIFNHVVDVGTNSFVGANLFINTAPTTVSGSTSGSATFAQTDGGTAYKKVVIYLNALVGTATFTFNSAFTHIPNATFGGQSTPTPLANTVVSSLSATAITLTGSTSTGYIILEGN